MPSQCVPRADVSCAQLRLPALAQSAPCLVQLCLEPSSTSSSGAWGALSPGCSGSAQV